MVTAIRQRLTVKSNGALEIRAPELRAGEQAEVIVLIEQPTNGAKSPPVLSPLEALKRLQSSLQLTPAAAQEWIEQSRAHREAWGERP